MGRRCNPVNLKSNTMKNTSQRYVFLLLVQTFSTELCSFLTIIVHFPVDMLRSREQRYNNYFRFEKLFLRK